MRYIVTIFTLSIVMACCSDDNMPQGEDDLLAISYNPQSWSVELPEDWPPLIIPADNPMTEEGIDLGRHLFYDNILSADNTQSCATCHQPAGSFTDNLALSKGIDGIAGERSAMSLVNVGLVRPVQNDENGFLFWDGRSKSLEEQALLPVEDPIELHNEWTTVVKELRESTLYPRKFREAFGIRSRGEITKELAAKAIAQFERSLLSFNSKFDKEARGEVTFSDDELDGLLRFIDSDEVGLFKHMECAHCHTLPLTTSDEFTNNALQEAETLMDFEDLGRGPVIGSIAKNGTFRTPTLRNVMFSAPYMHDGSLETIDDVLDHYLSGGHPSPNASPDILSNAQKNFTSEDRKFIKAFLETFTDTTFLNDPAVQNPFK